LHFAPDTDVTLEFTVALANTHPGASKSRTDELSSPEVLTEFLEKWTYTGRFDRDEAELADVKKTRDLFRRVWSLPTDDAVVEVNAMFRKAGALPYLVKHDHFDWHLHATDQEAPLAERIRVEVAIALADVIRSGEMSRLRVCEADDCDGLVLDLSRNGSKRYCSVRCGNRMNQLAFRERATQLPE
jgi:predicted RNA-binding Zn ribbon-like protein